MVIVASKRHFVALDEAAPEEIADLLPFARRIRAALRDVLEVEHVYYFYNEDTSHHFHLWMVPRYEWMDRFGRSIESVRPALRHCAESMRSDEELAAVLDATRRLRERLAG